MIPTFDKEVLVTIEKIIGIPFIVELYLDGSVCFANNDEVRPEFRQHFNVFHVLDYVNASICKSELPLKTDFIKIPYPTDSSFFWKQVAVGAMLRKSDLLEEPSTEKYFEIKWYFK